MKVFVDTSAFIALDDRSDSRHADAKDFYDALTASDRLFTSNYVVDEAITRFRYAVGHHAAVRFAEAILGSRLYEILYVDSDVEAGALQVLKRFRDKELSFTDCTTIALVQRHGLDAVFAFDDDFRKVGLRVAP